MWIRPWGYKEGIAIGGGLAVTGVLLQLTLGNIDWNVFAWPVNLLALCIYLALLILANIGRQKVYLLSWMSTIQASVTAMGWAAAMTVVMGLIRQVPSSAPYTGFPGFAQMVTNWSFTLIYFWMLSCLGLTTLRVCIPLKVKRIPFLLNHLGLFIALLGGVLGSADLQKLQLTAQMGMPEWRAVDSDGNLHELPIAVELKDFTIDEYPPKILVADNETGVAASSEKWSIEILQILEDSAPVFMEDDIRYNEYHSEGACSSAHIRATATDGTSVEGWVSCGSFSFPVKALKLDDELSAVMPPREPQRYVSSVDIYTQSGKNFSDTIKVNSPCRVEGWKIYQLSYDKERGKWSRYSVFEIVRDSWLPVVYVGIWMLIAGAVCMFVQFGRKKEEKR